MKNKKIRKLGKKCPYKPPRPPRCLCSGFKNWLFGIASPSLWILNAENKKAIEYCRKLEKYYRKQEAWLLKNAPKDGMSAEILIIDEMHTCEITASERDKK